MELNKQQKVVMYRKGLYKCPPPPVSTVWWTEYEWIKYIDQYGKWTDDSEKS